MSLSLTAQLLAVSIVSLQRQIAHNNNVNRTVADSSYDYIVVGSGSAGAIVAYRLASNPNLRVLLLEAGGPQTVVSDIPGLTTSLIASEIDWNYRTVPQTYTGRAFTEYRVTQPKGKVIGGSSTINWMLYNRGNRLSYDNWSTTYGATGWDYESVLPFFIRSENNTDAQLVADNPGYHGTHGRVQVSDYQHPDAIQLKFQEQVNNFGIPNTDINGENQSGFMIYQVTASPSGLRMSTGNAFIDPNPFPNNLHIVAHAHVTQVLFDTSGTNVTATGVRYLRNNITYTVNATREVIVSAGPIATPQLLMLSGIGPRDHLQSFDIPVLADLPVGNNFHDHSFIFNYFEVLNETLLNDAIGPNTDQYYDYFYHQKGPLTQFPNSVTYLSTRTNDNPNWPNTIIDVTTSNVLRNITQQIANYADQQAWREFFEPNFGKQYVTITTGLYRVYSRGTIRLASTDPTEYPLIDPNYLSDPRDMQAVVDTTKILFYLAMTGEFPKYARLFPRPIPGCQFCSNVPLYQCDSYIRCIIRQNSESGLHPGGSCLMGSANRTDAVVDPQLRVIGVDRLRVIDSSIFPALPNANTNAASMMTGEKGAQMILDSLNN